MNKITQIINKLETTQACTCQEAMYLHRLYLNIELYIERYFKTIGKKIIDSASYHKDLLTQYFKSFSLETSEIFILLEELRGFRHIFNKRADILEFLSGNIEELRNKILKLKEKIIEQFGEI